MKLHCRIAVLSLLLVVLFSITAIAGDTWVQENGHWYCYDADGNKVCGQWKSSDGKKYWLDETTGEMAVNRIIEDGSDKYYVNASGEKAVGTWQKVAVENGTDGYEYMYFAPVTGKAYMLVSSEEPDKTIGGKKYRFSPEGYMLYGYLDAQDQSVEFPSEAEKYYGTKEQGGGYTGWINVINGGDLGCNGIYKSRVSVWFYFDNGKKIKNKQNVTIETGKKYSFDANGAMLTGWQYIAVEGKDELDRVRFYGGTDDGVMKKSQWVSTTSYDSIGDALDTDYYLNADGSVYHTSETNPSSLKKIGGKYYCFDSAGKPQSDFVVGWTTEGGGMSSVAMDEDIGSLSSVSEVKSLQLDQSDPGHYQVLMYFGYGDVEDENLADENVGDEAYEEVEADLHASLQTGTRTIDGTVFHFDKHGFALEGIKDNKIYNNGIIQTAGKDIYKICRLNKLSTARDDRAYYMVDKAGNLLRSRTVQDDDGYWYFVDSKYRIYRMDCNNWGQDDFRKEASEAYRKNREKTEGNVEFTLNGATYVCTESIVRGPDKKHEKYVNVTWAYKGFEN